MPVDLLKRTKVHSAVQPASGPCRTDQLRLGRVGCKWEGARPWSVARRVRVFFLWFSNRSRQSYTHNNLKNLLVGLHRTTYSYFLVVVVVVHLDCGCDVPGFSFSLWFLSMVAFVWALNRLGGISCSTSSVDRRELKDILIQLLFFQLDSLTLVRLKGNNNAMLAVRLRRSTGAVQMKFRNLL